MITRASLDSSMQDLAPTTRSISEDYYGSELLVVEA